MADLAARIGNRRPLYGNLTWTRPGLEEEEKARAHHAVGFGKGHRLPGKHALWDRTVTDCDSEASSSNEEDVQRREGESDVFSSPQTPSKPRILRNRITTEKDSTLPGSLFERLGMSAPPEDGSPEVISTGKSSHLDGVVSGIEAKSTINNSSDQEGSLASTSSSSQTPALRDRLHPFKASVDPKAGERFTERIPGLNMAQLCSNDNDAIPRVEVVGDLPCRVGPGSSPELIDRMRQLLVPLVVKKVEREGSLASINAEGHDLPQQAQAVITDDICEEFIRQAIASSSALQAIEKENDHTMQDVAMPTSTRRSTPMPPGLGISTSLTRLTSSAPLAAGAAAGCVSTGKAVLPSHPLPTGPRSMKNTESASSHVYDDRGVGSSGSQIAYSVNTRDWAREPRDRQETYGFRQSPRPRRSPSPRSVSRHELSSSRNHSLSHSAHRPSPERYKHGSRRPYETRRSRSPPKGDSNYRVSLHHSRSRSLERCVDRGSTSGRGHTPRGCTEREAIRRRSPSNSREDRRPARQHSPTYDSRESQSTRREHYPYGDTERKHTSRYSRAPSPRHSISSSRAPWQAGSTGRGRSPHLPSTDVFSDRPLKRKSYSPVRRDGPPRGWSQEPPPQSAPPGPFPKKSKHYHDTVRTRLDHEPPPSPDRTRRVSGSYREISVPGSPSKYRHICHRPPGTCPHDSHYDGRRQSQSFERPPHSASSSLHSRREETCPVLKPEPQLERGLSRQPLSLEYPDTGGAAVPRSVPSTTSSYGDAAAAYASTKYRVDAPPPSKTYSKVHPGANLSYGVGRATEVKEELSEVPLDLSLNIGRPHNAAVAIGQNGDGVEARIPGSRADGSGAAIRDLEYQYNPQDNRKDFGDGSKPLGLSAAPTIINTASSGNSNWGSSSTVIQHAPTLPTLSTSTLLGQPYDDKDYKPGTNELEKLLAVIQAQQRQHPFPQMPVPPAPLPTQPSPPLAIAASPAGPVHTGPPLPGVMEAQAAISSKSSVYPSPASSRAPTVPPTTDTSKYVRIKVEDLDQAELWPAHEAQLAQAPMDIDIPQESSLPLVSAPPTTIKQRKPPRRHDRRGDKSHRASQASTTSILAPPIHSVIKTEPHDVSIGETINPEWESDTGRAELTIPGIWMSLQGADSVKTVDTTFSINDYLARKWGFPSQSEYDDSSREDEEAWATHHPPKVTLQLMCFSTDQLASINYRGCGENPKTLFTLPQKWPMIQDLIIVSNHDTPGQRVWMSHDLPKSNGTGRPILLERYFHSGPNTLRIIHLTNLSSFTFVLVAQPNLPSDEVMSRSVSSTSADKYDNYFAKLRKDVGPRTRSQEGRKDANPAVGSVTVLEISSDEEL